MRQENIIVWFLKQGLRKETSIYELWSNVCLRKETSVCDVWSKVWERKHKFIISEVRCQTRRHHYMIFVARFVKGIINLWFLKQDLKQGDIIDWFLKQGLKQGNIVWFLKQACCLWSAFFFYSARAGLKSNVHLSLIIPYSSVYDPLVKSDVEPKVTNINMLL